LRVLSFPKIRAKLFQLHLFLIVSAGFGFNTCSSNDMESVFQNTENSVKAVEIVPGARFDLSHWKLTLPSDDNSDGDVDGVTAAELQSFSHDDFFHLDAQGHMVFTAPNKGGTTANSLNTRSELRYMSRGSDTSIGTQAPLNNFAIASHSNATDFGSIGGKMEATLHIDHAPLNSRKPQQGSSYALVIGQIHATRTPTGDGFGYGNEPLKIVYKKWPNHETGSVYWHYERNLEKGNPNRKHVTYPVWGNLPTESSDPKAKGIALGEDFSYTVNINNDTMYLVFDSPRLGVVHQQLNLAENIDEKDNPMGYRQDRHYFKAGVYNQCRAIPKKGEIEGRCPGTGNWVTDQANGDYAQVSFSRLIVTGSKNY